MTHALLQAVLQTPSGGAGYRKALAAYLDANLDRLRAIARRKLDQSNRSVFDSDEVVSSVVRRLDTMAQRGAIRATSEGELWELIARIVSNATISRIRLIEVAQRHLADDGPYVSMLTERVRLLETDDEASLFVYRLVAAQQDATDRQILLLRMRGMTMSIIADQLGLSESIVKHRYKKVCSTLEALLLNTISDIDPNQNVTNAERVFTHLRASRPDLEPIWQAIQDWRDLHPTQQYLDMRDIVASVRTVSKESILTAVDLLLDTGVARIVYKAVDPVHGTPVGEEFSSLLDVPDNVYGGLGKGMRTAEAQVVPLLVVPLLKEARAIE